MVQVPKDTMSPKIPAQMGRGSPKALWGGVAAATLGLGIFWYAQNVFHGRKYNDPRAGAIPTWEYRMQQEQTPESNPPNPLANRTSNSEPRLPTNDKVQAEASGESGGAGWQHAMTGVTGRGDESTQGASDHADEPPKQRANPTGETYTKHGEYKDSYDPAKREGRHGGSQTGQSATA